jgi:hypothetical protein
MWTMSPVAIFDLEGGVSIGAADIRLPCALSCATRQGGLLLDGADGDPDVVRHQDGGQDSDGGNQASDGLVGHDIPSVSPRVNDHRARVPWNRQLEPATRCRAWQPERAAFKARSLAALPCLMMSSARCIAHASTCTDASVDVPRRLPLCPPSTAICSGLPVHRGRAELLPFLLPAIF